jgi:hypothetical protein
MDNYKKSSLLYDKLNAIKYEKLQNDLSKIKEEVNKNKPINER